MRRTPMKPKSSPFRKRSTHSEPRWLKNASATGWRPERLHRMTITAAMKAVIRDIEVDPGEITHNLQRDRFCDNLGSQYKPCLYFLFSSAKGFNRVGLTRLSDSVRRLFPILTRVRNREQERIEAHELDTFSCFCAGGGGVGGLFGQSPYRSVFCKDRPDDDR